MAQIHLNIEEENKELIRTAAQKDELPISLFVKLSALKEARNVIKKSDVKNGAANNNI